MRIKVGNMIKEALDNLPVGVCFFDENGAPLLTNRAMHALVYAINGRDLQSLSELENILKAPDEVFSNDRRVWRFQKRELEEGITEITAADITEIYEKKRELTKSCEEQRQIMRRLETVSTNIVSITRSEEILSMKMKVHNDLGYAISSTRRFIAGGFSREEKREFIGQQREMTRILLGETANDDEPSVFAELKTSAEKLGMEIAFDGKMPPSAEKLMTKVVRECLINAVRHADGNKVFVKSEISGSIFKAVITNSGKAPEGEITEGGGLAMIRKSVEDAGGTVKISGKPQFSVCIEINIRGESHD